jgi:lysozyme
MHISQAGLNLITSFEGYHRRLPNGDCTTYLCPAKVLTIGYGCTEGIKEGEVWTEQQAQERFRKELVKHEAAVDRMATVELNQNQFDALVSFSYNCGTGALSKSTLLKKLNAGDWEGAGRAFASWNKGGGKVLNGLVRRRAAEAALFLKPMAPPAVPDMPQAVDAPSNAPEKSRIIATASTGERVGGGLALTGIGLSLADALGYGGQILPLVKNFGLEAFIFVMLSLAAGFALVKHFRKDDHAQGKTVEVPT